MRLYVSIIGVFALFSSAAAAQVVVLGESPAARCYDAAIAGRQDGVAINECRTALDRRQISRRDRAATYINLGILYLNAQHYDAAMRAFDDAEAMNLVPPGALAVNRSNAMIRTGRFSEARQSYESALAVYPGFHFARRNLAILCDLYLADLDCALRNYEAYMKTVPSDEEASMWIADIRYRLDQ